MLVASSGDLVRYLTDWRTLLAAVLIGGKLLWTTLLRCLEAMVRDWYRCREKCARYRTRFETRSATLKSIDIRFFFTYAVVMGEMRRAIAHEQDDHRTQDRFVSTLVIAASIIAAVRLARDDISGPTPRLLSTVSDSVSLARLILKRVVGS